MTGTDATSFDRDHHARSYANRHLRTDPGIRAIHYLRTNAPPQEIRLVEVNELIGDGPTAPLEPIDFGVDTGMPDAHTLYILDVTPEQWERIQRRELALPPGWVLDDNTQQFPRR